MYKMWLLYKSNVGIAARKAFVFRTVNSLIPGTARRVQRNTQLFQQLFYLADHKYGGRLPIHVHFLMDEFANVSLPDDFDKILSVMRSREVSVSIILQNLAQLKALFEKQWESIMGNCVRPEVASAI